MKINLYTKQNPLTNEKWLETRVICGTKHARTTADTGHTILEICSKSKWKPYFPHCNPLKGCYNNRVPGLVGHWRMDEQTGNEIADDSGHENHGSASGVVPKLSKFSRGRYFNADGLITVPNTAILNFGVSSFSVTGWIQFLDVQYPRTTFAVKKGYGCYFGAGTIRCDTITSFKHVNSISHILIIIN